MTEAIEHVVDKSTWPRGAWDNEPDREHFVDEVTGLDCLIVRNHRFGNLCGYVGVPERHPWHGKDWSALYETGADISVHGGLTYSNHCHGSVCHSPSEAANEPVWWLGFDCAHSWDKCPGLDYSMDDPTSRYRGIGYVRSECRRLASQVAAAKDGAA